MRLQELRSALADTLDPPVTDQDVVEAVGDLVLESPRGVQETVAEALERQGSETFQTVEDAVLAVESNVRWEFVGRRRYDDRSPNPGHVDRDSF